MREISRVGVKSSAETITGPAEALITQGGCATMIMDILGYSQKSMTMSTYSHVLPALKQEAVEKMASLLSD
jgi:hypothetical protein